MVGPRQFRPAQNFQRFEQEVAEEISADLQRRRQQGAAGPRHRPQPDRTQPGYQPPYPGLPARRPGRPEQPTPPTPGPRPR